MAAADKDSDAVVEAVAVLRLDTVCVKVNSFVFKAVAMDEVVDEDDPESDSIADVETVAVGDPE